MYTRVFRLKLILTIVTTVTILTLAFTTLLHVIVPEPVIVGVQSSTVDQQSEIAPAP
jgi:hypothetical protein